MSDFSADEIARYQRHIVMPEIGGPGQAALKAAHVIVVGAGGLGAPVIAYLAGGGVGRITVVDDDTISLSNLHRQTIHRTEDVGTLKAQSARRFAGALNDHAVITTRSKRLEAGNAASLLDGMTLALDCTDNLATRRILAEACAAHAIDLISGAVNRFDGQVTVFAPHKTDPDGQPYPRYQDLHPADPPDGALPSCAEVGVAGPVTGLVGSWMALEAIKVLTGAGTPLYGRMLIIEGLTGRVREQKYHRR